MRLTDVTLRRLAYAAAGFCLVALALGVALIVSLATSDNPAASSATWGSAGPASTLIFVAIISAFPLVGVVVAHRLPRNTIAWLLLAVGLAWAWQAVTDVYAEYSVLTDPGSLPRPDIAAASVSGRGCRRSGSWART